jgi:hypothetical protein
MVYWQRGTRRIIILPPPFPQSISIQKNPPNLTCDSMAAQKPLQGVTPEEKLGTLGIAPGNTVDVRVLGRIANTHGIEVVLFFEEDLARTRPLASVEEEFGSSPEYERPFINVNSFLRFTRENDPSFEQTMDSFPLMIEIVSVGERPSGKGRNNVLFVTGLMPFLDELDVDAPLPTVI